MKDNSSFFFFQNFQWPSNPSQTLRKFYDAKNCQFLKRIFKNLENPNLILCVFVFNENQRFKAWTARKNYPLLRTPEQKSTKNKSEVQTCLKTTLILQVKIRLKSLIEIANSWIQHVFNKWWYNTTGMILHYFPSFTKQMSCFLYNQI